MVKNGSTKNQWKDILYRWTSGSIEYSIRDDMNNVQKEMLEQIAEINKWRWQVMGGAMALATLISVLAQVIAQ